LQQKKHHDSHSNGVDTSAVAAVKEALNKSLRVSTRAFPQVCLWGKGLLSMSYNWRSVFPSPNPTDLFRGSLIIMKGVLLQLGHQTAYSRLNLGYLQTNSAITFFQQTL